jgi:Tol biopolymer transport system component
MNKQFRPLLAFLALAVALLACAVPPVSGAPTISPDAVSTVVALTFQALTPPSEGGETLEPEPAAGLLPHSLYYLGTDNAGLTQVFRIERDGTTRNQVTDETVNVLDYGASPVDGSVAYVIENQLLLVNADGSDRRLLVEGEAIDVNNPFVNRISSPVFSPNGQTLAYSYRGLNLYALATGVNNLVLENYTEEMSGGIVFPNELYIPEKYSPDGSRLLITLAYYEGASAAIYYPDSKALVRLSGAEGAFICCGDANWTDDSTTLYSANPSMGMFSSGMWRVDAATGAVTTLLPGEAGDGTYNLPDEPFLAPDGRLYYFYANVPGGDVFVSRPPFQPVSSEPDGLTGRTVLREDTFDYLNEALWAPDASFVIVASAPVPDVYQGGRAEIVYLDGRLNVVLATFAQQMEWGP